MKKADCIRPTLASGEIEGDGDQSGMSALALAAGDMLDRVAPRFAGKLGEARLMHTMLARRIKVGGTAIKSGDDGSR